MPSQLLHILFGEDVVAEIFRRLGKEPGGPKSPPQSRTGIMAGNVFDKIGDTYKKAFTLGCQGPDIFYHSQSRRPVGLEYGTLLHRRGTGTFTAELLKMGLGWGSRRSGAAQKVRKINALGAYAMGNMTHAILDRLTHPYIVYKSDRPLSASPRRDRSHAFLERIIDLLMFRYLRGSEISGWDQEGMLAEICDNPPPGLKELLVHSLVRTFPERAGRDLKLSMRVENTFLDCAFFYRYTAPALTSVSSFQANVANKLPPNFFTRSFVAYLYPEDLPGSIDFLNLEKKTWYYPAGEVKEDTRSFPEIYADAVDAAAVSLGHIVSRYLEEGKFPIREAAGVIGNSGLSIVNEAGKPCAPARSDPFPLQEILDRQADIRGIL